MGRVWLSKSRKTWRVRVIKKPRKIGGSPLWLPSRLSTQSTAAAAIWTWHFSFCVDSLIATRQRVCYQVNHSSRRVFYLLLSNGTLYCPSHHLWEMQLVRRRPLTQEPFLDHVCSADEAYICLKKGTKIVAPFFLHLLKITSLPYIRLFCGFWTKLRSPENSGFWQKSGYFLKSSG